MQTPLSLDWLQVYSQEILTRFNCHKYACIYDLPLKISFQCRIALIIIIINDQALYVSERIQAGTCFVNCYNKTDVATPFGGFKQSGFGKDLGKIKYENNYMHYNNDVNL